MWKRLYHAAIFVLFAGLLFAEGCAAFSFAPHDQANHKKQTECTKKEKDGSCRESFWERTTEDPVAFFTLWLAALTAVLAVASVSQMRFLIKADRTATTAARAAERAAIATEKSIATMDKTAERQLRAYVFMETTQIVAADAAGIIVNPRRPIGPNAVAVVEMTIINAGQTPAYDVQIFTALKIVGWPLDSNELPGLPFNDPAISKTALGPGMRSHKYDRTDAPLSMGEFRSIATVPDNGSATKAIFVVGEIRYRDAFGVSRTTKYRYFVGGPTGVRSIALNAHEEGNIAD